MSYYDEIFYIYLIFFLIPLVSLLGLPTSVCALWLTAVSYLLAAAPTWLFLFGSTLIGARLTAFLYPCMVHAQWLVPLMVYSAAYLGVVVLGRPRAVRSARRASGSLLC